ncbi:hypothetical protein GCM10010104_07470 [Streptomyces indiaensis]|uniref:Uncharacterized protein n=1 Tax=Streptomyces indiaensis TaxID=284033 RepID=A0ABN3D585_9ACTN
MSAVTPGKPLETRETVCAETPASRATSAMEAPCRGRAARRRVRLVPPGSLSPFTVPTRPSPPSPRSRRALRVRNDSLTPEIRTV